MSQRSSPNMKRMSAKSRASSGGSNRARSKSPPKSPGSKSQAGSRPTSMKQKRAASGKSDVSEKKVTIKTPEFNSDGKAIINMSGQGMTGLPSSLFTKKDVGELDLSSNNLRNIPPEIRRLQTLTKIDLSRNGIRSSRANDYTGLPAEMEHLTNLEELCISECNMPHVPAVIWKLTNLRRLDISRNKINILVPDIGNLMKLRFLNLQQTNITTLPPEIAFCQDLEELFLWGNVIEALPETLKEMTKLRIFAVNHRNFSAFVDGYMENLLRKGQIQSEHIPPVLFDMPALEILDLEATKINSLPDSIASQLKEFYLTRNFFQTVPNSIIQLSSLVVLDMSKNEVGSLPESISKLKNLTILRLDHNQIDHLPPSIGQLTELRELSMSINKLRFLPVTIGKLKHLTILRLAQNQIGSLPADICNLVNLETLDLTENQIASLPINFYQLKNLKSAHSYQKLRRHGLWLHKNPLMIPPQEVWKTENPELIFRYLKKLQIKQTENLQRQKLYLLGDTQSGKTSLLRALTSGKSILTEGESECTELMEYTIWKTDNLVQFLVNDIGGHDSYKHLHHFFLDPNGLYIIVYDHRKYTEQNHHKAIGYWLDLLNLYVPGAVVKVVGTQCDLCNKDFVQKTLEVVNAKLQEQNDNHGQKLKEEHAKIEELIASGQSTHSLGQLKNQVDRMNELEKKPLKLQPGVHLVSAAEGLMGVADLVNDLEVLAVNKELFPTAQRYIPDTWKSIRSTIKLQKEPFLTAEHIGMLARKNKFPAESLQSCLSYMSDIGEILCFPKNTQLRNFIFHRPRHLVNILKSLFLHKMEAQLDFETNRTFSSMGNFNPETFEEAKTNFLKYGFVSRQLLKCLWFYLKPDYDMLNTLADLIPKFDLGYLIPQPDTPPSKNEYIPLMVIPRYNTDRCHNVPTEYWPRLTQDIMEHKAEYIFPLHVPEGLFETFACRLQDELNERIDWRQTVYGTFDDGSVLTYCDLHPYSYDYILTLTVRSSNALIGKKKLAQFGEILTGVLYNCPGVLWQVLYYPGCKGEN